VSFYLSILAVQEPTDISPDESNRPRFAFNLDAVAAYPVDKFEEEIARLIFDAGLGAVRSSVFFGMAVPAPSGDGPYIHIMRTSGFSPLETHNSDKYQRLSCQIIVRASSYVAARTRAIAIWRVLDGVRNTTITAA
jgi:hypothetical protein